MSSDTPRGLGEIFSAALSGVYRTVTEVLGLSHNEPEFVSLEDPDKASLAARITEVYWRRVRETGLGEKQAKAMRGELRSRVAACLNHFQSTAPQDLTKLEQELERYDRLREETGISRRLLEQPSRLLPGVLAHAQAVVEAILGAIPVLFGSALSFSLVRGGLIGLVASRFSDQATVLLAVLLTLFGFVTGFLPYLVTKSYMTRTTRPEERGKELTTRHLLVGVLSFSVVYGGLIGLVASRFSDQATVLLAVLLITTGPFALGYARRMRTIVAHLGDRTASWFKLKAVARLREAQSELVRELDVLRNRYREEVLGWDPLPAHSKQRSTRGAVVRVLAIGLLTASAVLFIRGYMDRPIQGLPVGPSPWLTLRTSDPAEAERELLRDAQGVLLAAQQLDQLAEQMAELRADFDRGERDFLTQEDQDEIHTLLVTYLDLRSALLKTVWLYRGENTEAAATTDDQLEANAFLTAYTASALLVEKAWLIYDTFRDDPATSQQLDLGDLAWGIPAGTFSNIGASLSNEIVMSELQMAKRRFESDREELRVSEEAPWVNLATRAQLAHPALDEVFDGIRRRRLRRAFQELTRQILATVDQITPATSMAISRFRFKERPPHRGLISPEQLEDIRAELRPGDILVERRNWYISNSLLPGFWPHTALYLGSYEELAELGVTTDPRVAPHMSDFQGQNELGDDFVVIEAIGEGVIFTSLEQSVGEADAVAILRPNLSDEDLREALGRALSHRGKEYDFDFDFETTDRLVCTELIFRTYDGILEIPPMHSIMGKPRISANDYVRLWADGRESGDPQLELVRFLDFDEPNAVAVEADAETLVETLERSRFTFLN